MHRNLCVIISLILWLSVALQFALMLGNRVESIPETIIRFFSFFTILTNLICAVYFTARAFGKLWTLSSGKLTAITMYITIVGLVYQLILRQIWEPTGLQKLVDEMLHSINPILVILFWYAYEKMKAVNYRMIPYWLLYPLLYLFYILIRGHFSGFYPYPFIHVTQIGLSQSLINSLLLMLVFIAVSAVYIFLARSVFRKEPALIA